MVAYAKLCTSSCISALYAGLEVLFTSAYPMRSALSFCFTMTSSQLLAPYQIRVDVGYILICTFGNICIICYNCLFTHMTSIGFLLRGAARRPKTPITTAIKHVTCNNVLRCNMQQKAVTSAVNHKTAATVLEVLCIIMSMYKIMHFVAALQPITRQHFGR